MRIFSVTGLVLCVSACTQPTDPMPAAATSTGRVTVERIGVVEDSLAYGARRGIYVIRDRQTGDEFIGVSGVGIAEPGHHRSGKSNITDER